MSSSLTFAPSIQSRWQSVRLQWRAATGVGLLFLPFLFGFGVVVSFKPMLAFLFVAAFAAVLLAFFGTRFALPLYFATTLGTAIPLPFIPISGNRLAAGFLLLAALMEIPFLRRHWNFNSVHLLFWVMIAYVLGITAFMMPEGERYPSENFFYLVLFLIVTIRYYEKTWMLHLLAGFTIANLLTQIVPGLIELALGRHISWFSIGAPLLRLDGLANNAIVYGYYNIWLLPFVMLLALRSRNFFIKLFYYSNGFLLIFLAIATENRQTIPLLAAAFGTYILFCRYRYRGRILAVMTVAGILALPLVGAELYERFSAFGDVKHDKSLAIRYDKALIASKIQEDYFWTGIGHANFQYRHQEYIPKGETVLIYALFRKNQFIDMGYIQIFTEYGLIGTVIITLLMIAALYYFLQVYILSRRLADPFWTNVLAAVAASFALLIIGNFIQDVFLTPRSFLSFAFLLAAGTAVQIQVTKETGGGGTFA